MKKLWLPIIFAAICICAVLFIFTKYNDPDCGQSMTMETISEGGASICYYDCIPQKVVDSAVDFIKGNGYHTEHMMFLFCNSRYAYGPEYVVEEELYMYRPGELTQDYPFSSEEYLYYIEGFYRTGEEYILFGYFTLDENGELVEEKYLQTENTLSSYPTEINIQRSEAVRNAKDILGLDGSADTWECSKFWNYPDKDSQQLCYRITFPDGQKILIDGATGEQLSISDTQ